MNHRDCCLAGADVTLTDAVRRTLRRALRRYQHSCAPEKGKGRLRAWAHVLSQHGDPHMLTNIDKDLWMVLDLDSDVERDIYYCDSYRRWVTSRFEAEIRVGSTVVDVGANVGEFVLRAARRTGPQGLVIGFEPSTEVFRKLERNIALSDFDSIQIENLAVSDFCGEAVLHLNPSESTNQGQASLGRLGYHGEAQLVQCTTLDAYLSEVARPYVDLLKIDTQGHEMACLRGATETLERCHPTIIVRTAEEQSHAHGDSPLDVQGFLFQHGYDLYEITYRTGKLRQVSNPEPSQDATFMATVRPPASLVPKGVTGQL